MIQTELLSCGQCGNSLSESDRKANQTICSRCLHTRRIRAHLQEEYISRSFATFWVRALYRRLGIFLEERKVPPVTQDRLLTKAKHIFQEAENTFSRPEAMGGEWLETQIKKMSHNAAPTFLRAFLIKEQFIFPQEDEKLIKTMQAKIESLPQEYRRLVEVYFNERLNRRKRQIELSARKPLSLRTLESDLGTHTQLIRWLREHMPELTGWNMVQEEHILTYLLTLSIRQREVVRKDLYAFFRLARKRKLVTHVPVANYPTRELPLACEPLNLAEQKALARLIRESIYTHPGEAFSTALCFYHGLSSSQLLAIKMSDVDIERRVIHIQGRPPVYLASEDFLLLEQFLQKRSELPYATQKSHLIISNQRTLKDEPLDRAVVRRKVLDFAKYPPQRLRMTCFTALSEQYGPQYLVEAFGLSLSHAARFAKIEEYLLEEEVKQQREAFQELSHRLKQSETQRVGRSRRRKGQ